MIALLIALATFNVEADRGLQAWWYTAYRINCETAENVACDLTMQRDALRNAKACLKKSLFYQHKLKLDEKRLQRLNP